jgi:4-hydroxybenzoate polyprenyltransferase
LIRVSLLFCMIAKVLKMIKFEHSVFALPFAFMSAFLAHKAVPPSGKIMWILIAMISARSAAMAFNRVADLNYDQHNPRTANWILSRGELSRFFVIGFVVIMCLLFLVSAYQLNDLCFKLAPVALAIILLYSFTKRFTSLTHFFLGLSLSLAPMGAWLAINAKFELVPVFLSIAVILWTAGFDIIYSTQDIDFDRKNGLHSIPARYGIKTALIVSSLCHLLMILILVVLYVINAQRFFFMTGIIIAAAFLVWQHSLVKPHDLSRVNEAFFTANGLLSVFLFIFTVVDILW